MPIVAAVDALTEPCFSEALRRPEMEGVSPTFIRGISNALAKYVAPSIAKLALVFTK